MSPLRILVCGSRYWDDETKVWERLTKLPIDSIIIHGAAKGADTIAGEVGKRLHFTVEAYPADWNKYGRAAGPVRNSQMLATKPDLVLAFCCSLETSKGTKDTVRKARALGIPVEVIE